jgi:hypothetical protein
MVSLSSLKSSFVPTKIVGAFGQWWFTSGYHWKKKKKKPNSHLQKESKCTGKQVK